MHGLAVEHGPAALSASGIDGKPAAARAAATARSDAPRPFGIVGRLVWCTLGFLAGAAFWHLVGFWSFISYVVLGGPEPGSEIFSARPAQVASADRLAYSPPVAGKARTGAACVTLALDRVRGETRREPCETSAPALPHVPASRREDLAQLRPASVPTILPESGLERRAQALND
jgi:hypothetical protein